MGKKYYKIITFGLIAVMLMAFAISANAKEKTLEGKTVSQTISVDGKNMHVVMYGDMKQTDEGNSFADPTKTTLVMLPALAVPSPNIYFKPLAQSLDTAFNVVVIEPFGYGLSELADTDRTVENMNKELAEALETLEIDKCALLVHSLSGIYGMEFASNYPEKVTGFIAIDNTVYDDELVDGFAEEQEYMLEEINKFNELKGTFSSVEEFQEAITKNPEKYGAALPQINGFEYSESDSKEYIQAFVNSSNANISNEIMQVDKALVKIKDKKFAESLPVLTLISSDNVEYSPSWESGHRNQLVASSEKHELYILEGSHYIWYTNLSGIVEHVSEWQVKNQL